jgi:hypothetical protein
MATQEQKQDQVSFAKTPQHFANLWTIHYRHGMNATLSKNFFYDGDLNGAIARAQEHCKIMNYKYIFLRPLIVDIDKEEEYKLKGGSSEPSS